LHQAVDAFQNAVIDPGGEPAQDPLPVALNRVGGLDDRLKPAVGGPEIPFVQKRLGLFGILLPELLKVQSYVIGPRGF